ncbi:YbaL family putative K(+) efflux transporter [Nitrosovibrio sp. Nv6]|uniref:YbaL family putative K(+) efflux transporter n=1 Tax=Nitrosovibrio sp. Nv6 TaxID=1855340 RepID=UPI0008AF0049|nr:YbaL family putative K(+) efflux transporter [Nitrosovibrio sp. Nv6]SEO37581.1 monovalent cation:H+ antiporter-2, CPA2 family [Nitrosovibrio sp. Nv6]
MPHSFTLITTIAVSFGLALLMGLIAHRLKLPVLLGYLVAGVILGSNTPGFVADIELSGQLAEIGVILLMFGVGLHFSLKDLLAVRRIALPGAIVQIGVATTFGAIVAVSWGWTLAVGIVFGVALSTASTVVLLRALEQRGLLKSVNGSIAVGWLIVEDLAMVLVLVLLPPLAGWLGTNPDGSAGEASSDLLTTLLLTFGKVSLFIALMLVVGKRVFPWLLWHVASTNSNELFILSVIAVAIGIAYGSAMLFGVSFALGAFFAGMVMRESDLSHRAAQESLPLRDAFSVLFFVSVGMLFDPDVLTEQPLHVLATLGIIIVGKSLAAFLLVLAFRYPLNTALTVSASLAQIGEFSFILAALGVSLGLLPVEAQSLILAGAFISITLNPLVFRVIEPAQAWIRTRSRLARILERSDDPLAELPTTVTSSYVTSHVVIVGYGRVGGHIGEALAEQGLPLVVAEQNREIVEGLRKRGIHAVAGDAAEPAVLIQAHIARAAILVIAVPDTLRARRMIETARMLNPPIEIIVRTHNDEEAALLRRESGGAVFLGEHELALSMTRHVLTKITASK